MKQIEPLGTSVESWPLRVFRSAWTVSIELTAAPGVGCEDHESDPEPLAYYLTPHPRPAVTCHPP